MADFGTLYGYDSTNGTVSVIPDTLAVRAKWETAFKTIFNDSELSVDTSSAVGRIIEALTFLCVNVLGVNAQNANQMNPSYAVGQCLDAIGNLFGVARNGRSDTQYRDAILSSQSLGAGYEKSISNAIIQAGATSSCVLENGYGVQVVKSGISLQPHSIFACVSKPDSVADSTIAEAIAFAKSAGCGYTDNVGHGTLVTETVTRGNSTSTVKFYKADTKSVQVVATVTPRGYVGTNIVASAQQKIVEIVSAMAPGTQLYTSELAAELLGIGILCMSIHFRDGQISLDSISVMPYEVVSSNSVTATVTAV